MQKHKYSRRLESFLGWVYKRGWRMRSVVLPVFEKGSIHLADGERTAAPLSDDVPQEIIDAASSTNFNPRPRRCRRPSAWQRSSFCSMQTAPAAVRCGRDVRLPAWLWGDWAWGGSPPLGYQKTVLVGGRFQGLIALSSI